MNGKYVVQGEDGKVTQVLNYLIEKERKAKISCLGFFKKMASCEAHFYILIYR